MEDVVISLFVVLAAALCAGAVFVISSYRRKQQNARFAEDCTVLGWTYAEERERLRRTGVIHGGGWRLETGLQMAERSSESGSPDAYPYTRWECAGNMCLTAPLRLGTVSGAPSPTLLSAFPSVSALFTGETADWRAAVPFGGRFLLLGGSDPSLLGQEVETLLADWPKTWPLRARIAPDGIIIELPGKQMKTVQEAGVAITLGQALLDRFAAENPAGRPEDEKEEIP